MPNQDITEISGVWTSSEVTAIQNWISSQEGIEALDTCQQLAKVQSKEIVEIAKVDASILKVPFIFNM